MNYLDNPNKIKSIVSQIFYFNFFQENDKNIFNSPEYFKNSKVIHMKVNNFKGKKFQKKFILNLF